MNKGEMLYEGKAKQVFATENPEEVIVNSKTMPQHLMHKNVEVSI